MVLYARALVLTLLDTLLVVGIEKVYSPLTLKSLTGQKFKISLKIKMLNHDSINSRLFLCKEISFLGY